MNSRKQTAANQINRLIAELSDARLVHLEEVQRWASEARLTRDDALIARANFAVGMCGTMQGQDTIAEQAYAAAARHYSLCDDQSAVAVSNLGRAQALFRIGQPLEALKLAKQVGAQLVSPSQRQHASDALMIEAIAHHETGDSATALTLLRRVRRSHERLGAPHSVVMLVDVSIANALAILGRGAEAHEYFQRVLRWSRGNSSRILVEAAAQYNLGCLLAMEGNWQSAFDCFREARVAAAATGNPRMSAAIDLDDADLHLQLNLLDETLALTEDCFRQLSPLAAPTHEARAFLIRATARHRQGDWESALADYRTAQERYAKIGNHAAACLCSCHIGVIQLEQGWPGRAARSLDVVQKRFPRTIPPLIRVQYWELRARIALARRDRASALTAVRRASTALATTSTPWLRAQVEHTRGVIHVQRSRRAAAVRAFESAIESTERSRHRIESDALVTSFLEGREQPYSDLVQLYLERRTKSGDRTIFRTIGRLKSHLGLAPDFGTDRKQDEPLDDLREQANLINSRLARLHGQRGRVTIDRERLQRQLEALRNSRDRLEARISRTLRNRRDRGGSNEQARLDPEDVQRDLPRDATLVEYFEVAGRWIALVCTADRYDVIDPLVDRTQLYEWTRKFNFLVARAAQRAPNEIGTSALRSVNQLLTRMSQALLTPIERHLCGVTAPRSTLYLIPHGVLHQLPLVALPLDGAPLIAHREVCILPNRRFLAQRRSRSQVQALAVGIQDENLPGVRQELRRVATAFERCDTFYGAAATRAAFRDAAPRATLLHLATHAQFRADNPMHSALEFGDGWLAAWEIAQLPLHKVRLAVLAACESAKAQRLAGDELLGLARGFFAAGVRSLIVNHWPLRDDVAQRTTRLFYESLTTEASIPAAFRKTLLGIRELHPHPAHWASLTLMGCAGRA